MKKLNIILLTAICFCFINLSCDKEDIIDDNNKNNDRPAELTVDEKSVVVSNNNFAFELFKEINNQDDSENIFISPLSIGMALAMTYNGAIGETKQEMGTVLGFENVNDSSLNVAYKGVYDVLMNSDEKVEISLANSIWYTDMWTVDQSFSNIIQTYYNGEISPIDLSNPTEAKDIINEWVENKTKDKIKDLLKQIQPEDVMFLVNAIYYKSDWTYKFNKEETIESNFYKEDSSTVKCQMMRVNEIDIKNRYTEGYFLIELPYGNKQYGMVIILPNGDKKVNDIIGEITIDEINSLLEDTSKSVITVHLPKFKVEYESKLNDILIEMGINIAFDPYQAEFPELFENVKDGIWISRVRHKAFIEVNEEGTEAAAATVVVMAFNAINDEIWFNKPFIYLIRENTTGTILFMGKLMDPS